jgi:hypothetical protein
MWWYSFGYKIHDLAPLILPFYDKIVLEYEKTKYMGGADGYICGGVHLAIKFSPTHSCRF